MAMRGSAWPCLKLGYAVSVVPQSRRRDKVTREPQRCVSNAFQENTCTRVLRVSYQCRILPPRSRNADRSESKVWMLNGFSAMTARSSSMLKLALVHNRSIQVSTFHVGCNDPEVANLGIRRMHTIRRPTPQQYYW